DTCFERSKSAQLARKKRLCFARRKVMADAASSGLSAADPGTSISRFERHAGRLLRRSGAVSASNATGDRG
ncbi:hypothetical protein, partial [Salmonella enterica]|uniref:hypothetical protein n=1 Tax=Salmonella enterica TaxID=28901 RepID=UPI003FA6A375